MQARLRVWLSSGALPSSVCCTLGLLGQDADDAQDRSQYVTAHSSVLRFCVFQLVLRSFLTKKDFRNLFLKPQGKCKSLELALFSILHLWLIFLHMCKIRAMAMFIWCRWTLRFSVLPCPCHSLSRSCVSPRGLCFQHCVQLATLSWRRWRQAGGNGFWRLGLERLHQPLVPVCSLYLLVSAMWSDLGTHSFLHECHASPLSFDKLQSFAMWTCVDLTALSRFSPALGHSDHKGSWYSQGTKGPCWVHVSVKTVYFLRQGLSLNLELTDVT